MKMKKMRKMLFAAVGIGAAAIMIREIYCMVMYLYNISIKRGNKAFLTRLIDLRREEMALSEKFDECGIKWYTESKHKNVYSKASDGTKLYARIFENASRKWVIAVHGFGETGEMLNDVGIHFYSMGYNVVIPDCRGHGRSGGEFVSMGYFDKDDIALWIRMIEKIDSNAEICLYGVSMGAAAVLMCAGELKTKSVKCVISDCSYTSAYDIFKIQLKNLKLPPFPILNIVSAVCRAKNGFGFKDVNVIDAVKHCKLPVLFIHGEMDKFVPLDMLNTLYNAKIGKKEKLIIEGAGHGVSALRNLVLYWAKIRDELKVSG